MKHVKKVWEAPGKTMTEPYTRNIQVIYTPQHDDGMRDYTFLIANLYPVDGQTGYHTHPVVEMILILSGRGEGRVGDEKCLLEPGTVLYAPAGVFHECKNTSDESMKLACYFTPALPDEVIENFTKGATVRSTQ